MHPILALLTAATVSAALSAAVLRTLSEPLLLVLERICPDGQSARFWLSYTRLMLTLAPLLITLSATLFSSFEEPVNALRMTLLASLAGLLAGLHVVGRQLARFITVPVAEVGQ